MIYKRLSTGMLGSNCYIIGNNGVGVIIDPGADTAEIMTAVKETGLKIEYILLTHAHIDHICSMDSVREKTGAKVAVHRLDAGALADAWKNVSKLMGLNVTFKDADLILEDGSRISIGGLELEIIHTPGHTPGCICIKAGNTIFTGDTLFRMSVGRTDFTNGSQEDLVDSIKNKLFTLDEEMTVYPGHGTSSTIGYEKKHNPYV